MFKNVSNRIVSFPLNGALTVVLERPKLTFNKSPRNLLILAGLISFLLTRPVTAQVRPESLEASAVPTATQTTTDEATRKRIEELIAQFRIPLGNPQSPAHDAAIAELGEIGQPAVLPLIKALSDKDSNVRISAARTLGEIGDPEAVKVLSNALEDINWNVRQSAAEALGKIADPKAIQPLIKALSDRRDIVRQAAAVALGQIGDPQAVQPLINALSDRSSRVLTSAVDALGTIGDPRAVQPLITALGNRDQDSRNSGFRGSALVALTKMGQPAVQPLIEALADEKRPVRSAAAIILGRIGDPQAVEALIKALEDEDWIVRDFAVRALGKIGDPRAVEALIQALDDKKGPVSASADSALRQIDDPRAAKIVRKRASAHKAEVALSVAIPIVIGLVALCSPVLVVVGVLALVSKSQRKSVVQAWKPQAQGVAGIQHALRQNSVPVRKPQGENAAEIPKPVPGKTETARRPIRAMLVYLALVIGNAIFPLKFALLAIAIPHPLFALLGILGFIWLPIATGGLLVLVYDYDLGAPHGRLEMYYLLSVVYCSVFFLPLFGALYFKRRSARVKSILVQVLFVICHAVVLGVLISQTDLLKRLSHILRP